MFKTFALIWAVIAVYLFHVSEAGLCFLLTHVNGNCHSLLNTNKTPLECCSSGGKFYTKQNLNSGMLFRVRILKTGVPCLPCDALNAAANISIVQQTPQDICAGINCGEDKVCVVHHQIVNCVCDRNICKNKMKDHVCSNHNRTYRRECALRRRACIYNRKEQVAYYGRCRANASCKDVECRHGKQCIEDQMQAPHCVYCNRSCMASPSDMPVCGADGITYSSYCHLRKSTCLLGRTIGVRYSGPCKANCSSVTCPPQKKCLMDNKVPRCIHCGHCVDKAGRSLMRKRDRRIMNTKVCGTDSHTYLNICTLKKHACATGIFIGFHYEGSCTGSHVVHKTINQKVQVALPQSDLPKLNNLLKAEQIQKLKNKTITVKRLFWFFHSIGLNITLTDKNRPQDLDKTVEGFSFICQLVWLFTKTTLTGCSA